MQSQTYRSWLTLGIVGWLVLSSQAHAQIVPDTTLPTASQVIPGCTTCVIEGGTAVGSNLFHSFFQFSVPTGGSASFNHGGAIQAIFTRVTGPDISSIDGLLRTNGGASLFLLNPNGIVLGPNARLDVPGSFVATTASSFKFPDGSEFSATQPQSSAALTMTAPLGLQYGPSRPDAVLSNAGNLAVGPGQSLTLLGGITTNTGSLTAPGGTVQVLGDQVSLLGQSRIDVSSATGGGTVLVGGGYQGQGALLNSRSTLVGSGTAIEANALAIGDGGTVIIWSDGNTSVGGSISAQGGALGGNGGLVETSGKQVLTVLPSTTVSTQAAQGQLGTWLLDPDNLTIVASGGTASLLPGDPTATPPVSATIDPNAPASSSITAQTIVDNLQNNNVDLLATLQIQVDAAIGASGNTAANAGIGNLSLQAPTIILNAPITLQTDRLLSGTGTNVTVNSGGLIQNGIDVAADSGATVTVAAGSYTGSLAVNKNITLAFDSTAGVNVAGNLTASSAFNLSGSLTTSGSQTYNAPVILGTNTTAATPTPTTINLTTTNGNIEFQQTVNSATNTPSGGSATTLGNHLTVTAGAGTITFTEAVGGTHEIGDLVANSSGTTQFSSTVRATSVTTNPDGTTQIAGTITTSGNQTYNDPIQLTGSTAKELNAGTGTLTLGAVTAGTRDLTLTADEINLGGVITGTGNLILQPFTVSQAIAIGGSDNSTTALDLTGTELGFIQNSFTIGQSAGTGTITIPAATTFNYPVTIQAPGVGGAIAVNAPITANGGADQELALTLRAAQINLSASSSITALARKVELFGSDINLANGSLINVSGQSSGGKTAVSGGMIVIAGLNSTSSSSTNPTKLDLTNATTANYANTGAFDVSKGNNEGNRGRLIIRSDNYFCPIGSTACSGFHYNNNIIIVDGSYAAPGYLDYFIYGGTTILAETFVETWLGNFELIALNDFTIEPLTDGKLTYSNNFSSNEDPLINFAAINLFNNDISNTIETNGIDISIQAGQVDPAGQAASFFPELKDITGAGVIESLGSIDASLDGSKGGNITVQARGDITLNDSNIVSENDGSGFSQISIQSSLGSVFLTNSTISAAASGSFFAGDILVNAFQDISIQNSSILTDGYSGRIFLGFESFNPKVSDTVPQNILITDSDLSTNSIGNTSPNSNSNNQDPDTYRGDISLKAQNTISVTGGEILAETIGIGKAGNINLAAPTLTIDSTTISTAAQSTNTGDAGSVTLTTGGGGTIDIQNGSSIIATSIESSNAGEIQLSATSGEITIDNSSVSNQVVDGNGNNITITSGTVKVQNGSQISAETLGEGQGGNVVVTATQNGSSGSILQDNSTISTKSSNSDLNTTANAGSVTLTTGSGGTINIQNGSRIVAGSENSGDAGEVKLSATNGEIVIDNTYISNEVVNGTGNNITLNSRVITVQNSSQISAETSGIGQGGNIVVTATQTGGDGIILQDNSTISSNSINNTNRGVISGGNAGSIQLEAIDGSIQIANNSSVTSNTVNEGNSGEVTVRSQDLKITEGSVIQAASYGSGAPGDIDINVDHTIEISGTSSRGRISEISTFSGQDANLANSQGNILINQSGSSANILLADRGRINATTQSTNPDFRGGEIEIYANNLTIATGGQVIASSLDDANPSTGQAGAGNIQIEISGELDISGLQQSFADDPLFSSSVLLKQTGDVGNFTYSSSGTLESFSIVNNGVPISTLYSTLGLTGDLTNSGSNTVLDAQNGSGVQLSFLGDVSEFTFDWNFLTNEFTDPLNTFDDSGFVAVGSTPYAPNVLAGGTPTNVASVTQGSFVPSLGTAFSEETGNQSFSTSLTAGQSVSIGAVNVGDTLVTSGLQVSNLRADGSPIQVLTVSPDVNPNQTFFSGIFAQADGTGNAGTITITGKPGSSFNLNDSAQISSTTVQGGAASPSSITISGFHNLTATNSAITASTDTGTAGEINITAGQSSNGSITLEASRIEAKAGQLGGSAGGVVVTTPTLTLDQSTIAASNIGPNASGIGGTSENINLQGLTTLSLTNGSEITASTDTGAAGSININSDPNATPAALIALSQSSEITAQATGSSVHPNSGAGNIRINAQTVNLVEGSNIQASNQDASTGGNITLTNLHSLAIADSLISTSTNDGVAGNVTVHALSGSNPFVSLFNSTLEAQAEGTGNAGGVLIQTATLTLLNNSLISASTNLGQGGNIELPDLTFLQVDNSRITASTVAGRAGSFNLQAANGVLVSGPDAGLFVSATLGGEAGSLALRTPQITLLNGASISVDAGGTASAGDITLQPWGSGSSVAVSFDNGTISGSTTGSGRGGSVNIEAPQQVTLSGNGQVAVETSGSGPGGNLTIRSNQLDMYGGAQLSASTLGSGEGGSINILLSDALFLDGNNTGIFASTSASSSGKGGSIFIDPRLVQITNGAGVSVDSRGSGDGGNLELIAGTLNMSNQAFLSAATASGEGGNISLKIGQFLFMRHGSLISATAGGSGNGGNMTIDAPFIIGVPRENSDIVANAFRGRGGNITINTQGIFGLVFRPRLSAFSDITASSEFGLNGMININSPGIDPSRGLTTLPANLADPANQISQSCAANSANGQRGEFTVVGRGGLPTSPEDMVDNEQPLANLVDLSPMGHPVKTTASLPIAVSPPDQIQEAQGWSVSSDGVLALISQPSEAIAPSNWQPSGSCSPATVGVSQ